MAIVKKRKSWVAIVLLVVLVVGSLAGCGGGSGSAESSLVGKWEVVESSATGRYLTPWHTGVEWEFFSDGTIIRHCMFPGSRDWHVDGSRLRLGNETFELQLSGSRLTIMRRDGEVVLRRI